MVTGKSNITGTLNVTGNTTLSNVSVTGLLSVKSDLKVTGNSNITGTLNVTGNTILSNLTVNSNTVIGGGLPVIGYILTVSGSIQATSYNANSDRRLKSNINFLPNQANSILKIEPVTFDWKINGKRDIGFIAQNIYKTYPELIPQHFSDMSLNIDEPVDICGNPIYYSIDYGKMTPFLWQGMREIIQRLEVLENENKQLKLRVENLESK
jgi:hypothetical protein